MNDDGCMTFAYSGDNGGIQQDDYLDVNGSGKTLDEYCDEPENNCCNIYIGIYFYIKYISK